MPARWILPETDSHRRDLLARQLGISPVTAQVLVNRGLHDVESARGFLSPQLKDLADPNLLPGMSDAVERIDKAARDREKIVVYGDYDVDGTAATALLVKFLRMAGLDVDYYIPHRIEEGYGLNLSAMAEFKRQGITLIITVDCGVSAVAEVEYANNEGMDVIVTDHHEPGDDVARACAVINAKLTGSMHPFRELSGVGVAFKFAWAAANRLSTEQKMSEEFRQFLLDSLGLVALGTVADIVPLLGENRILTRYGLRALGRAAGPGLQALIESARIRHGRLTTRDISYGLAPRLNAAGRMADAGLAIELMMAEDESTARSVADTLDQHNSDRQRLQHDTFQHAHEMFLHQPDCESARAIVLAHDSWHPGVIGIVASKLVEDFSRPAALIAIDGSVGRGSARSVPGFHLFNALEGMRHRMISFGGHAGAAGFQIATEHIPELRGHLERAAAALEPEMFEPSIEIDAEVSLYDLSERLASELEMLAPYGERNRRPLFVAHKLAIAGKPKLMGARGQHVSFYVNEGDVSHRAVGFNMGEAIYDRIVAGARTCSLVFSPRIDTYRGSGALELHIKDIRFD